MKYEERRRALHRFARVANPPPFDPTPEGEKAAQVYGDYGARCAPFLDEVVAVAREYVDAMGARGWASFASTERLRERIDKLDGEAARNPEDSLAEVRQIIFDGLGDE